VCGRHKALLLVTVIFSTHQPFFKLMKATTDNPFVDQILQQSFKIEGRAIHVNSDVIRLLGDTRYNYFLTKHQDSDYINVELIPTHIRNTINLTDDEIDELFPGVRKRTFGKAKLPSDELRDDIERALRYSNRYHSNFYEIKDQNTVELKSRTLAVMSVVVRVIRESEDYQLLYSVLKAMDISTEIPLKSGKEFYQYARDVFDFGLSKLNQ
jgi:hypothetical protein